MYTSRHLDVPSKTRMERMYSTSSPLKGDTNMSSPKKDNMFQSMFNVLNGIWEHVSKVPGSFMANVNSPLSVTLVQKEGIISHEFFKSLTSRTEPLTTDHIYKHNMPTKESLNVVEHIDYSMFDKKIPYANSVFNEKNENLKSGYVYVDAKTNGVVEKFDRMSSMAKESMKTAVDNDKLKSSNTDCNTILLFNNSDQEGTEKLLEPIRSCIITNNVMPDFHSCSIDTETSDTCKHKQFSNTNVTSKTHTDMEFPSKSSQLNSIVDEKPINQLPKSCVFTNIWQKVVGGVTDRLNLQTESLDLDKMMKRSVSSPKQRRKVNAVAKGRGRGRARSQLRRSGVSQTRHRKERTKHDLLADMQDDFDSWQEIGVFSTVQCQDPLDCFSFDENGIDMPDAPEFIIEETVSPLLCTFADVKLKSRKPKTRKRTQQDVSKFPLRVRYVPECAIGTNAYHQDYNERPYDLQRNAFRPRLMSESSVDSEDSYCIVFETDLEADYKTDLDDNEESDEDESTEDEESISPLQKVKFNLKPTVHVMVQWDYAYRAARRGPWEEMARDRERFKGRINCIERVLNPILTSQHRTHIWQERFAFSE